MATAAVALVAGAGGIVVLATGGTHAAGPHRSTCADRLLKDWSDGRIDGTYPVRCYRAALKALPTDIAVYSSAPEDITHALSKRIIQGAKRSTARSLTR